MADEERKDSEPKQGPIFPEAKLRVFPLVDSVVDELGRSSIALR